MTKSHSLKRTVPMSSDTVVVRWDIYPQTFPGKIKEELLQPRNNITVHNSNNINSIHNYKSN